MSNPLPSNVHVSKHPCVRAKISQLRSRSTNAKETKALVHEIGLMAGAEALAHGLQTIETGTVSLLHLLHASLNGSLLCRTT